MLYQEMRIKIAFWYLISNYLNSSLFFKDIFNNYSYNFDDVSKMANPALFKIKIFWNKGDDIIIYVLDVPNKILWRESNYIVYVAMWPKFGNSSGFMIEVMITSIL